MRIKKTSQTTPIQAQVVNTQSNSTTDSYSCNYVNSLKPKILQIGLTQDTLMPNVSAWTHQKIPFDKIDYNTASDLTFSSINNNIIIGDNVSHIRCTFSCSLGGQNNGNLAEIYTRIKKNGSDAIMTLSIANSISGATNVIANYILSVTKNDVIDFYVSNSNTTRKNIFTGSYATIEVID